MLRVPVKSDFPMVGEVDATYESLHLVTVERGEGARLVQRERMCTVRVDEDLSMFDLHISPRAVRTLPATSAVGALHERDGKLFYEVTLAPRHLGMSRSSTQLPSRPDESGVRDTDEDGAPGLTLSLTTPVGTIDVYIVQRDQAVLIGEVKGAHLVEGDIQVLMLEQRVIGTKPSLTDKLDLKTVAQQGRARFQLFRVPEGASCDGLTSRWASYLEDAQRMAALREEAGALPAETTWAAP